MMPLLARPLPNIFESDFSWYGRIFVIGFKRTFKFGFTVSLVKSYSSKAGNPRFPGRHRCFTFSTSNGLFSNEWIDRDGSYSGLFNCSSASFFSFSFATFSSPSCSSSCCCFSVCAMASVNFSAPTSFKPNDVSNMPLIPLLAPLLPAFGWTTLALLTTSSCNNFSKIFASGDSKKNLFLFKTNLTFP